MILNAATFILTNLKMIKLTKEKKKFKKVRFLQKFLLLHRNDTN